MSAAYIIYVSISVIFCTAVCDEVIQEWRHPRSIRTKFKDNVGLIVPKEGHSFYRKILEINDGYSTARRKKRAINFAAKGALTLWKLLSGAKPVYSEGSKFRNFRKQGDYVTALMDFQSADPVNTIEFVSKSGAKVMIGWKGDRKLKLVSSGSRKDPVLDVIDYTGKELEPGLPFIDRIIYTKHMYK